MDRYTAMPVMDAGQVCAWAIQDGRPGTWLLTWVALWDLDYWTPDGTDSDSTALLYSRGEAEHVADLLNGGL